MTADTSDGGLTSSGLRSLSASGRARSRSPSRPSSRSTSRSPSRQRRGSNVGLVGKQTLCIEGFFYANQYEGPYGKHIAVITHAGTATFLIGIVMALIAFTVFQDANGLLPMKVTSIVILIIGVGISVSTTTVYARAHKNVRRGTLGRLNLNSEDILLKIALSFTIFLALSGIVIVPIAYSMSSAISIFNYIKYVGIGLVVIGIIGFIFMSVYCKVWTKRQRAAARATNQQRRPSRLPRSRANSEVVPEIRVEEHNDTTSELGTGSDITEAFSRRASLVSPSFVITSTVQEPPPYCERDPHPGAWSDTGSSVLAVSATHSMVTLLQYAYADELDTPPPPYTEADHFPTVSVTPVQELNDELLSADAAAGDNGEGQGPQTQTCRGHNLRENQGMVLESEQLNCPSTSTIGLSSPQPSPHRPNARSLSSMLVGMQTDSTSLTVPDT